MGKDIGWIHKHGQSQLSTPSIKAPVLYYSASQTSSSIESIITYVPSVIDQKQTNSLLCSKNSIHNDLRISKIMLTYSPVKTQIKQDYIIPNTSTTNHHAQRIVATSINLLNLHTTTKLYLVGKWYKCVQNNGKTDQSAKCIKSRIMTKVIDYVLLIDIFEQQYVVIKYMLQSLRLKYHVKTIVIDQ